MGYSQKIKYLSEQEGLIGYFLKFSYSLLSNSIVVSLINIIFTVILIPWVLSAAETHSSLYVIIKSKNL